MTSRTSLLSTRVYDPIWKLLTPEASRMVRLENHDRLFDQAKKDTRAWKKANLN